MRAWGGDPDGRRGGGDDYEKRLSRAERERDRREDGRKVWNDEKWTPERDTQDKGEQAERIIKGGQPRRNTRVEDNRGPERETPRRQTSGRSEIRWHQQARKDAGREGKAENQEGARKVAKKKDEWYQGRVRSGTGKKLDEGMKTARGSRADAG